ncbi:hypothetical protein NQ315_005777 [Exocentrus adspersus]|uniref:Uncharacterized protein n=1 Tax=Exocentrus adspersus TaxID=1586481 RepID=A0AAV8VR22_9CUCU|nr:hypothetical protein NQ315_005777 [Exocentrus adspersus]
MTRILQINSAGAGSLVFVNGEQVKVRPSRTPAERILWSIIPTFGLEVDSRDMLSGGYICWMCISMILNTNLPIKLPKGNLDWMSDIQDGGQDSASLLSPFFMCL